MNIFIRAWRSFLYRTRHIRVKIRVCGLGRRTNKKALLVGVPNHSNIGDMAITVAEKVFLKNCRISFASLTTNECEDNISMLKKAVRPDTVICFHGGGNLGNLYEYEERIRRMLLTEFSDNPSVIFPQTVHFTSDGKGEADMKAASAVYGAHKKLTIALRDDSSIEVAKELFGGANLIYSPDIVMGMDKDTFGVKKAERNGALLCFRHDFEKALSDSDKEAITSCLAKSGISYGHTDMMAENDHVAQGAQYSIVSDKMRELSGAKLVITDRLHGMIFSAITETPCIAFGNFNHKVEQSYKVLKHLDYIKFVNSAEEATELAYKMYGICGHYDRSPITPQYDGLKNILLEYTRKQ